MRARDQQQQAWVPRSLRDQQSPDFHHSPSSSSHQVPLSPSSFQSPRLPLASPQDSSYYNQAQRKHSTSSSSSAAAKAFHSVFHRKPTRATSGSSLRSAYSASTHSSQISDHPTSHTVPMAPAPLPVVSSRESDFEEECPVCLEPLSFSFRLPGEKPHIVPECGHALHEACFSAVYGPPPNQARSTVPRKANLGVCGVCRRPMKVGDGDSGKSNKLAALTGMGDPTQQALYPGRETPTSPPMYGTQRRGGAQVQKPYDPNADDPLEQAMSVKSHTGSGEHSGYIVAPSIQVRPEFSSLTRTQDQHQPLTCIVVIELPGKRAPMAVPGQTMRSESYNHNRQQPRHHEMQGSGGRGAMSPTRETNAWQQSGSSNGHGHRMDNGANGGPSRSNTGSARPSPQEQQFLSTTEQDGEFNGWSAAPSTQTHNEQGEDSPFHSVTEDLRNRIIDWKGHPLSGLGPLQMFDLLSVRRDALVREFFVYLFKEAIICVVEEKKRAFGRLLSQASNATHFSDQTSNSGTSSQSKGVLRLKGRIYVRHIKQVTASSAAGEMSLTIDMEDERLDSFILIFKERASLEAWKNNIQSLVSMFQAQSGRTHAPEPERPLDIEEFGGSAKAARMLSGSTATTVSTADSLLHGHGSSRSTMSSSTSHGSNAPHGQMQHKLSTLGEEDDEMAAYDSPTALVAPHMSAGPSNSLTPLPHPSLDLILVVSLPPPSAVPSTAQLKIRVIKATLDFILASLAPKDRLSLVTFEVGIGGHVRKTPFLSIGRMQSRQRLSKFIEEIGVQRDDGSEDEFLVRGSKEEKTDVVTAVNHGLDVVLQRKSRNPVSGLILVSDASDSTRRAQMDLVLARAEAANIPIHSFGYGRSHDPASLWLISNHTSGTYTFVKDWYDLRDCVAGCVGGMMSIGLLNMKLHLKIVDGQRFKIRKVSGGPSSILASDGHDVDVDVGELRYGEKKEMLIELELDNADAQQKMMMMSQSARNRSMNATDQYVASLGLDSLSLGDTPDIMDGMMDRMIDEVPVFEVDGSFFDPTAGKHISRLAHPVLLTVTLLPASNAPRPQNNPQSDPVIVRRRMELLASDMITRALVLVSRKNFPQAQKILSETKRILHTVLGAISRTLPAPNGNGNTFRNRKEILTLGTVRALQAILQDLQILSEALDENVDLFAHDQRNFGAQQAMILRDQKSWSGRSATERLFWTIDSAIEMVSRSTDWVVRD